jgi:hypothetical protein
LCTAQDRTSLVCREDHSRADCRVAI